MKIVTYLKIVPAYENRSKDDEELAKRQELASKLAALAENFERQIEGILNETVERNGDVFAFEKVRLEVKKQEVTKVYDKEPKLLKPKTLQFTWKKGD